MGSCASCPGDVWEGLDYHVGLVVQENRVSVGEDEMIPVEGEVHAWLEVVLHLRASLGLGEE